MGRKKNNPYIGVDSDGTYKDSFAPFYFSMVTSEPFMQLSDNAKALLIFCKACRRFHKSDFGFDDDGLSFYFNREIQKRFGLGNPNRVYKGMRELVSGGFIEIRAVGWNTRTKNVYGFSNQWQRKAKGQDVVLSETSKQFLNGRS